MSSRSQPERGVRHYRALLEVRTAATPEDLVLATGPQLRDASNVVPLAGAVKLLPRSDRLTLELQLASSADDDWRDSDLVSEFGLAGATASTYWTNPAGTLLAAGLQATEAFAVAIPHELAQERAAAFDLVVVPLGQRPAPAAPVAQPASSTVTLEGISPTAGAELAGLLRDNIDDERWGPARQRVATVAWQPPARVEISYHALDDATAASGRIGACVDELSAILLHSARLVDRVGVVAARAVRAQLLP